jgi:uncharacterized secreted protein with C-terminal beta-propeller domain
MNKVLSLYIVGLLLFGGVVLLAGCSETPIIDAGNTPVPGKVKLSGDVMKFNSTADLDAFLRDVSNNQNTVAYRGGGIMMDTMVKTAGAAMENSVPQASGATDYSQTNVQVKGVDEADFVKNDDKYIYLVQNNQLIIVDAYNNKEIISETDLPKNTYASNMFLYGDKVVVLATANEESFYFRKYDIMPQPTYEQATKVLIYDVTNKDNPKLDNDFKVSGNYFESRMIDNIVYLVAVKYASYPVRPPMVYADKMIAPPIYYFDNGEEQYNYNTIVSIDVDKERVVDSQVYLLGYSNTLMMSEDNIYIAYQKQPYRCWGWYCRDDTYDKERFTQVVIPLLQGTLKTDIQDILKQRLTDDEQWTQISDRLTTFFNQLQDDEDLQDQYQDMFNNIQAALDDYDARKMLENSQTIIHKISVDKGNLNYVAKGAIDGRLLNQFSLDEYDGYLRVATTVDLWLNSGRKTYNNVYVLDSGMDTVGSLENVATNETIYSTRFMGDKLYMVTFKQIDPFFVIDLSNPRMPEVLGELKIPGYSSYLHPYKDNFIIGVGKNTEENQWGGTSIQGVKISLFDVTDFNKPKEVDTYDIGMEGTDTPIMYEHKAFLLFDNIMVIPVSEITSRNAGQYGYNYAYWDGAYVFKVSESGFELLGKVKHDSRSSSYYNWYDRASVTRSIIMDNELFTISNKFIKVNDLNNNLKSLSSIDLPSGQGDIIPIYAGGAAVSEPVIVK